MPSFETVRRDCSPALTIAALLMLAAAACSVNIDSDDKPSTPARTETKTVDRGTAEMVRMIVRMGAGQLRVSGAAAAPAPHLLDASFHTSFGIPTVAYKVTGARGTLEIENREQKFRLGGSGDNRWTLNLDNETPIDLEVHLGAGETELNLSQVNLRTVEVHMGVGELRMNLDGDYKRDVDVDVRGGVGQAEIRLPRRIGALVDAKGGIGDVKVRGLKQDGGKYVNAAYEKSSRQVRCNVRGGVGEIVLIGDEP